MCFAFQRRGGQFRSARPEKVILFGSEREGWRQMNMVLQKERRSVNENESGIIQKQLTAIHQGERMRWKY